MRAVPLIAFSMLASPAAAEVVSAAPNGFHIRQSLELAVPPQAAFDAFGSIGRWWNDEHTYSGVARNMSVSLRPGGCFCEQLANGGGVEHMRVAYVDPGKRLVLTGSLGPLLNEATTGAMDMRFEPSAAGTRVTMDYKVAGFADGGADSLAPPVDQVLADQMRRFQAFATSTPGT